MGHKESNQTKKRMMFHCMNHVLRNPGLEVIKLFSYSTQLSMKFILLINVKMPTIVGFLTFISMMIQHLRDLNKETSLFVGILVFNEQLKFHTQLS